MAVVCPNGLFEAFDDTIFGVCSGGRRFAAADNFAMVAGLFLWPISAVDTFARCSSYCFLPRSWPLLAADIFAFACSLRFDPMCFCLRFSMLSGECFRPLLSSASLGMFISACFSADSCSAFL